MQNAWRNESGRTSRRKAPQTQPTNTPNTARIEHDKALERVVVALLRDDTELFKQFFQNESFRRWLTDSVFRLTRESGRQQAVQAFRLLTPALSSFEEERENYLEGREPNVVALLQPWAISFCSVGASCL